MIEYNYTSIILKSCMMISPPSAIICAVGWTIHPLPNVTLPWISALAHLMFWIE